MDQKLQQHDLTEGVIWKKLLSFFFPILGGLLFQQLYNTVDAVIVGKFVGTAALAAVGGSAAMIINLLIGFFVGLSSGATVIISQQFGAADWEKLRRTVHTTVVFCVLVGVGLTAVGYVLTPWMLRVVRNPEDIMAPSIEYLRIYFLGTVALLLFNVGSGILRAVGDSRRPLYFLIACCLLNIALDLLFVAVCGWGVAGVAWATVISLCVSAALALGSLCVTSGPHKLQWSALRIDVPSLRRMLYIGIPSGVQSAMYAISNLIVQIAVNGLGTTVVAAWTATGKFDGVYWVTSNAFGVAICTFVGQCFGAGKYERMKKSIRVSMLMAVGTALTMSALLLSLARVGMRIITDDEAVIAYAVEMFGYFVPYYFVWSFIEILSGALRGAGDAVRPTVITILCVCGLRILWVLFVVPRWHTVMGISLVYVVSWAVAAVAFVIYYYRSDWLARCIKHS